MTADTVILTYFPHKDPKTSYNKPTFARLHDFHKLLKYNATNVPTKLTNDNYGLIPMIISPTDWENLYGHEWIPPNEPGAPPNLATGTSPVNMKNIIHIHQK